MATARTPTHHRLRRDAEANRQRILDAAGQLMAKRGLATPLEDIAAEAGVGIGTLYRRFPSRRDLIEALFEDRVRAALADAEASLSIPDGWEALVWFLEQSAAREIADRGLGQVIQHGMGSKSIETLRERFAPIAEKIFERARASGRLRPDVTPTDLAVIERMVVAAGVMTVHIDEQVWRRYLTFVLDGLMTGRAGPTAPDLPALDVEQIQKIRFAD
jgi:AcrR family transcriptional regulator